MRGGNGVRRSHRARAGGGTASGNTHRGIVFAPGGIWGFSGTCAQLMTSGFGVPVSDHLRAPAAGAVIFLVCGAEPRNPLAVARRASLGRIAAFALLGVLLTQVSYLSAISYRTGHRHCVGAPRPHHHGYVCLRMRRRQHPRGRRPRARHRRHRPHRHEGTRLGYSQVGACSGASSRRRVGVLRCFLARCWRSGAASS
ncbi:MAG: hypothetical protein ACLTMP_09780 [Eggerthella lenta]